MQRIRYCLFLVLCALLCAPLSAKAVDDICKSISSDADLEKYFAENKTTKLDLPVPGKYNPLHLEVVPDDGVAHAMVMMFYTKKLRKPPGDIY